MQRIDTENVSAVQPIPGPSTSTPGFFQEGDPGIGILGTRVSADWLNGVQEEITNVIEEAGLTPNKSTNSQLKDAILALIATYSQDLTEVSNLIENNARKYDAPVGTISAWVGGYFGNASNGSFTATIGNTIATANAYMNEKGFYVCDGSILNLPGSPIYGGSGRYLPNLTDSRFLMGSTAAGAIGGENTTTLAIANLPSHTHSVNITSANTSNNSPATVASDGHSHTPGTASTNLHGRLAPNDPGNTINWSSSSVDPAYTTDYLISSTNVSVLVVPSWTQGLEMQGSTLGNSASTSVAGTSHLASHSHSVSGNTDSTGSGTGFENRPAYLSVFYIIRAI